MHIRNDKILQFTGFGVGFFFVLFYRGGGWSLHSTGKMVAHPEAQQVFLARF